MNPVNYNFWIYIQRSEGSDLWVAHCLRLDVVDFGDTPKEALENARAAVEQLILDDLNSGLDPLERQPAPDELWEGLHHLFDVGRRVDLDHDVADREKVSRLAQLVSFSFARDPADLGSHPVHTGLPEPASQDWILSSAVA